MKGGEVIYICRLRKSRFFMDTTEDEKQLRELFENIAAAWNKGDAQLFASYYTEDCDYITFMGQHIKGRQANAAAHQILLDKFLKGSQLKKQIKSIQFLKEDIALIHGTGAVQLHWQKQPSEKSQSITTNVAVKENGEWKVRAFHNCRIQKPGLLQRILMKVFGK